MIHVRDHTRNFTVFYAYGAAPTYCQRRAFIHAGLFICQLSL